MCQIMMCGAAAKESKAFRGEVFIELQHWACVSPQIIFFFMYMFSIEFQHQGWTQMAQLRALPNLPSALLHSRFPWGKPGVQEHQLQLRYHLPTPVGSLTELVETLKMA